MHACNFLEKEQKRGKMLKKSKNAKHLKIFENLGKNVQNLKNILKLGRCFHAIIGRNKLLEKALGMLRQEIL